MAAERSHLALVDEVLIYLVALVAITLLGGLLPAVLSAVAASLLLNWFFTPPLHTWTVDAPQNLLALVLFVSSPSSSAARFTWQHGDPRPPPAAPRGSRPPVPGPYRPRRRRHRAGVLRRLSDTLGGSAELVERVGDDWVAVASGGTPTRPHRPMPYGPTCGCGSPATSAAPDRG